MFNALKNEAKAVLGSPLFSRAFVKIQPLFKDPRWGKCSVGKIVGKGVSYLGLVSGELPDLMSQFSDLYENNLSGIRGIMEIPNKQFASEVLQRLIYRGVASQSDDLIIVNTHALDWWACTAKLSSREAGYFAAMATALIVCEYEPDKVSDAIKDLQGAVEDKVRQRENERKKIKQEIQRLEEKLKELN